MGRQALWWLFCMFMWSHHQQLFSFVKYTQSTADITHLLPALMIMRVKWLFSGTLNATLANML